MANPWNQLIRWRLRKLLAFAPRRDAAAGPAFPPARQGSGSPRIGYLFAGTYGDFVQCLPALRRLAAAWPGSEIILCGAPQAREFLCELPRALRPAHPREPWSWLKRPVDLLFTNAVGVYRVRFDFLARFGARRAFGFRHSHETRRGGYTRSVPLDPQVRNFADENLRLLDVAGVPAVPGILPGPGGGAAPPREAAFFLPPAEPWGRGRVLFHIGSAGLKRDFGLPAYARLVLSLIAELDRRGARPEIVMGPGDEDIALEARSGSGHMPGMHPMSGLIRMLRAFEGTVLCFNSFLAHLCRYLGKPAIVIHRGAVPYGYDCGDLHRQIVLQEAARWDLKEVFAALETLGGTGDRGQRTGKRLDIGEAAATGPGAD